MGEEKAPSIDEIAEAYAKMMGELMSGLLPICNAITTGLHGYKINVDVTTDTAAGDQYAFVTVTYPDRKTGTQNFQYAFNHKGICEAVTSEEKVHGFMDKLNNMIAEDNAIRFGDAGIEKMMQEWEGLKNR